MKKTPRVKEILTEYDKGGLNAVSQYLHRTDLIVDSSSWAGKLKKDIINKYVESAILKLDRIDYKFTKKDKKDGEEIEPGK